MRWIDRWGVEIAAGLLLAALRIAIAKHLGEKHAVGKSGERRSQKRGAYSPGATAEGMLPAG